MSAADRHDVLTTCPDGWSFDGAHFKVRDALFRPRPARDGRRHPPIILGGEGGPRFSELAARFADEVNIVSATPRRVREAYARVRAACADIGRDPDDLTYSAMTGVLVADTQGEMEERVRAQLAFTSAGDETDAAAWLAERRRRWIMGTPDEAAERVAEFAAAGVQRIMLQDFLPRDVGMVAIMGRLTAA